MQELAKEIAGRNDIPASVRAELEAVSKDVAAVVPKFAAGGFGGRGGAGAPGVPGAGGTAAAAAPAAQAGAPAAGAGPGGRGGAAAPASPIARLTQAKNGLMGGIWPTDQTMRAYDAAKTQVPQAIGEANALFAKAAALSSTLAKYKLTLTAPGAVKVPALQPAKK